MRFVGPVLLGIMLSVGVAHAHVTHGRHEHRGPVPTVSRHEPVISSHRVARSEFVKVSWYGLHDGSGHRTAEGRPFNPRSIGLAAPPTYAFGTRMRVTVVETGATVVATVMDRNGPGVARGGRKFDLFYGTAKALGIVERGTARVLVETVLTSVDAEEVAESPR